MNERQQKALNDFKRLTEQLIAFQNKLDMQKTLLDGVRAQWLNTLDARMRVESTLDQINQSKRELATLHGQFPQLSSEWEKEKQK